MFIHLRAGDPCIYVGEECPPPIFSFDNGKETDNAGRGQLECNGYEEVKAPIR